MSGWIRHRGSKSMPKCLEGKRFEVRHRDGVIAEYDGKGSWYWDRRGNDWDIFAFRILGDITPPDYSKGFPVDTTAKSIGAKVGDKFVLVTDYIFRAGTIVTMDWDDGSVCPRFTNGLQSRYINFRNLAPIPPKTAIELQAEEVGIPEPVQLVDDDVHLGIKRPDGDGWVKYNAGDVVDLDGVVSIDWADKIGYNMTCTVPEELRWADNETDQIAWYRLNYGDKIDTSPECVKNDEEIVHMPTTAPDFLQSALNTLTQRGKDYDKPEGERSAAAVAVAFNAITGKDLTDAEVYLVLQLVKDVRQWQCADYHADSALDCVAYAALKAEALAGGAK